MGIFVDIGPVSCFVSPMLVPPGYKFDATANPPCWASADGTGSLSKSSKIRLKIVGTRLDKNEIFAIGASARCRAELGTLTGTHSITQGGLPRPRARLSVRRHRDRCSPRPSPRIRRATRRRREPSSLLLAQLLGLPSSTSCV
jgi:hypothetical protein